MSEIYIDPLGNEWDVVLGATLNELFGEQGRKYDPEEKLLFPRRPPDDKRAFPAGEALQQWGPYVRSGTASHAIHFVEPTVETAAGFCARSVQLFNEVDWFGECYQVLAAHGWNSGPDWLNEQLLEAVIDRFGATAVTEAKRDFGENWTSRILELAATFRCKPFSRLWYCANMLALFYCHHDDLRLGFLWAEYQQRMSSEVATLRGKKIRSAASSGGAARARAIAEETRRIVNLIDAYISYGHSLKRAAELAASSGYGTSAAANKKRYERYKRKS